MACKPKYLINQQAETIAALDVDLRGDRYEGVVSLDAMPAELRRLFEEFEEIVEGQEFGLLDAIEGQIQEASLRVQFEDGCKSPVIDLQVFPSTNAISFRTRSAVAV